MGNSELWFLELRFFLGLSESELAEVPDLLSCTQAQNLKSGQPSQSRPFNSSRGWQDSVQGQSLAIAWEGSL